MFKEIPVRYLSSFENIKLSKVLDLWISRNIFFIRCLILKLIASKLDLMGYCKHILAPHMNSVDFKMFLDQITFLKC